MGYVRSRWEANVTRYLKWLETRGVVKSFAYEPKCFEFKGIRRGTRFYTPDFRVEWSKQGDINGVYSWVEVKGYLDPRSITRLKRFKKYYPAEFEKLLLVIHDKHTRKGLEDYMKLMAIGVEDFWYYADMEAQVGKLIKGWEF